jgi:hypothetical protein
MAGAFHVPCQGFARIFGEAPTFLHLDGSEEESIYETSPFHSFVNALPLDEKLSDEAIRGAVESVQEIARGVLASGVLALKK